MILALAGASSACAPGPDHLPAEGSDQSLATIEVPEGFTFATKRPVTVAISSSRIGADEVELVDVLDAEGRRLFTGALRGGARLETRLPVPIAHRAVRVRFADGELRELHVDGDRAEVLR